MSDQELEMLEDDILDEQSDQEVEQEAELDEAKKASMGDPSEIPDATASKTDEKPKGKGDSMPKTKIGMINAMVDALKGQKKDNIAANYDKMMKAMYQTEGMHDDEDEDEDEKNLKASKHAKAKKESKKITKEDIDVSDDVKALFGNEQLSEEFKDKATTIFEAAVIAKVNEIIEDVSLDYDSDLESDKEEVIEDLTTKLDDYLEYVAEEWMKENELAVEKGIRAEIVENFMFGLRNLFSENYIDIPEEKVDLVDELASKIEELENSVNEEVERNIALKKDLTEMKKEKALLDVCEGLTETQKEKMASLAEGVDYDDDTYAEKLDTIKENYFPSEGVVESDATDEEPLELEEEVKKVDGSMAAYTQAISRSIKK